MKTLLNSLKNSFKIFKKLFYNLKNSFKILKIHFKLKKILIFKNLFEKIFETFRTLLKSLKLFQNSNNYSKILKAFM